MNKVANVVLLENSVINTSIARNNAAAILQLQNEMANSGGRRSGDYQVVEKRLIEIGGYEVSTLHSGRSRVDLVATNRRLLLRDDILAAVGALLATRQTILRFGKQHKADLLPVYTQGRQSAGTPLAHYITAYMQALEAEAQNLREAYDLTNQSPLGAATGITSSFVLDRQKMASLLGFAKPIWNSLFATEMSLVTAGMKIVAASQSAALLIGSLAADLVLQYSRTYPWFIVQEGRGLTSRSSSMPHKVNPTIINDIRQRASILLGVCATYMTRAHNLPHGMPDSKRDEPNQAMKHYTELMELVGTMFGNLSFVRECAREEVELEYSATPELADILQRDAGLPFRLGHEFCTRIVDYGKQRRIAPRDFPYAMACTIFAEVLGHNGQPLNSFPLTAQQFAESLSVSQMVASARGLGGPQPLEVERMLDASAAGIASDAAWLAAQLWAQSKASAALEEAFLKTAAQD